MSKWISVKEKLPEKNGKYLVVVSIFDNVFHQQYRTIDISDFATNLREIDEYVFDDEDNRPGFYSPDDEVFYYERSNITHWMRLPELPLKED